MADSLKGILSQGRFRSLIFKSATSLIGKGSSQVNSTAILLMVGYWRSATAAGSYSLAVRYMSVALGLTMMGFDTLLIRDVAQDARRSRNYLRNLSLLRLITSCLAYGVLTLFICLVPNYTPRTIRIVLLLALCLMPEGLYRLYQSALIALDAYTPLAWVGGARAALGLTAGVGSLWLGTSLEIIVLLQVAVSAISLLLLLLPLRAHMQRMCSLYEMYSCEELSWYKAGQWLRQASSFAVIDGLFVLDGQIDLLLLSFFVGEARVGYYGLAQAVVAILMLLLYSVDTVVYPLLSRSVTRSERLGRNYWQLMGGISAGVIPLALLLVFGAGLIVPHYFSQFKPILSPFYWLTVSWAIHFINVPSARLIIGLGRQNCVATFVAIGVTITTLLSLLTIPLCGIQGPGIARAISAAVYALLCIIAVLALLSSRRCGRDSTVDNTTKGLLPSNPD